jgi:small nuclear ribonucleoprotein B and B'
MDDGRQLTGQMLAFDKHMNLVLADTEEFRRVKSRSKKATAPGSAPAPEVEVEEKRTLGLIIVRGTHVVSLTVEGPPPADPSARLGTAPSTATLQPGPGISRPAGRGLPVGLTGPAAGVGSGPAPPGFGGFPGAGAPRRSNSMFYMIIALTFF